MSPFQMMMFGGLVIVSNEGIEAPSGDSPGGGDGPVATVQSRRGRRRSGRVPHASSIAEIHGCRMVKLLRPRFGGAGVRATPRRIDGEGDDIG